MGNAIFIISYLKKLSVFFAGFSLCIIMAYSCANTKPQVKISIYRFDYNEENYHIRSILSANKAASCNEILGKNFVATDYDQDRFIDQIIFGEISLSEAQKVYEYGLSMLAKENKLRDTSLKVNQYLYANFDYDYEIKSFRPKNVEPFNQFKVSRKRQIFNTPSMLIIDQKADGILDEIIKGTGKLEDIQSQYSYVIKKGLEKNELIKVDNMILVKEK